MQLKKIEDKYQEDFISSFWTMLRECETFANEEDDKVLKHWVSQWYKQWNAVTDSNAKPLWEV